MLHYVRCCFNRCRFTLDRFLFGLKRSFTDWFLSGSPNDLSLESLEPACHLALELVQLRLFFFLPFLLLLLSFPLLFLFPLLQFLLLFLLTFLLDALDVLIEQLDLREYVVVLRNDFGLHLVHLLNHLLVDQLGFGVGLQLLHDLRDLFYLFLHVVLTIGVLQCGFSVRVFGLAHQDVLGEQFIVDEQFGVH